MAFFQCNCSFRMFILGKPQKKVLLLMAGPLIRPNPPPPLKLNGRWNVGKKSYFFLNGPALYPSPPTLNGPAIKRRTFFCGFPYIKLFTAEHKAYN